MHVILQDVSNGLGGCLPLTRERLKCLCCFCVTRCRGPPGEPVVRLGVPLVDDYLEFLQGRCRPNTLLTAAYDLRVFFGVDSKAPEQVRPADVLAFMSSQRTWRVDAAVVSAVGRLGSR